LSSDQNRQRPRSSKKRRATQPGVGPAPASGQGANRPPTQRVAGGLPRAGSSTRSGRTTGGIPTAWLAGIAIVVVAVGIGFASGAIKLGGGPVAGGVGAGPSTRVDAYSADPSGGGIPAGCPTAQPPAAAAGSTSVVTINTSLGAIELTLKADLSPIAVGNFLALAKCGYYDGVVFHRIVPGFVIQGGDGRYGRIATYGEGRAGTGGPGYEIQDEKVATPYQRGTVAMARTSQPNSVGSQFFIVLDDGAQASLASANTYQIIGSATKGMEVVDAIASAADGENPSQPVAMTKLTVSP
jgi:peptidyl-prolyl cis-trans isomerase B (cyclophilin B)